MVPPAHHLNEASRRALALVGRHVSAPIARPIAEADLLRWLRSGNVPPDRLEHVRSFIDETDTATLQDLVLAGTITYGSLARIADRFLPDTHDTRRWLDERRGF